MKDGHSIHFAIKNTVFLRHGNPSNFRTSTLHATIPLAYISFFFNRLSIYIYLDLT